MNKYKPFVVKILIFLQIDISEGSMSIFSLGVAHYMYYLFVYVLLIFLPFLLLIKTPIYIYLI